MLGQLARFYDTGVFDLPGWALEILYKCIEPIRAEEATWQANAGRTGQMLAKDYEKQLRRWQDAARPIKEVDTAVVISPAYEAWFKQNGLDYRLIEE